MTQSNIKFVTTFDEVRNFCITHNLFTYGTIEQYNNLANMIENNKFMSINDLTEIIVEILKRSNSNTVYEEFGYDYHNDIEDAELAISSTVQSFITEHRCVTHINVTIK